MSVQAASLIADVFAIRRCATARFRLFYVGSIAAALGYTMQATVAAWLMATLTPSALMVALVQTASTAPSLLFGLLAGALADIVDRRRVVLMTQALLFAATVSLGIATLIGWIGPLTLLALTFLIGAGFTFYMPAQRGKRQRSRVARGSAARRCAQRGGIQPGPRRGSRAGGGDCGMDRHRQRLDCECMLFVVTIVAVRGWKKQRLLCRAFPSGCSRACGAACAMPGTHR